MRSESRFDWVLGAEACGELCFYSLVYSLSTQQRICSRLKLNFIGLYKLFFSRTHCGRIPCIYFLAEVVYKNKITTVSGWTNESGSVSNSALRLRMWPVTSVLPKWLLLSWRLQNKKYIPTVWSCVAVWSGHVAHMLNWEVTGFESIRPLKRPVNVEETGSGCSWGREDLFPSRPDEQLTVRIQLIASERWRGICLGCLLPYLKPLVIFNTARCQEYQFGCVVMKSGSVSILAARLTDWEVFNVSFWFDRVGGVGGGFTTSSPHLSRPHTYTTHTLTAGLCFW